MSSISTLKLKCRFFLFRWILGVSGTYRSIELRIPILCRIKFLSWNRSSSFFNLVGLWEHLWHHCTNGPLFPIWISFFMETQFEYWIPKTHSCWPSNRVNRFVSNSNPPSTTHSSWLPTPPHKISFACIVSLHARSRLARPTGIPAPARWPTWPSLAARPAPACLGWHNLQWGRGPSAAKPDVASMLPTNCSPASMPRRTWEMMTRG